jgi:hypothetical protein
VPICLVKTAEGYSTVPLAAPGEAK